MSEIILNKEIEASPSQIWTVLTSSSLIGDWFYPIENFSLDIDSKQSFEWEGEDCMLIIKEKQEPELLKFELYFSEYNASTLVEITISDFLDTENMITVHLEELENFPNDNPAFETTAFESNWGIILDRLYEIINSSLPQ